MDLEKALLLGALQGVSELFPVSSLAQTILIPALLGWNLDREGKSFLAFVVALHLATAIALVVYFHRDWARVVRAFFGSLTHGKLVYDRDSKFAWLLVAGTVVVGLFGLALEKRIRQFFEDPRLVWVVAVILIVNGFFMIFGDVVKHQAAKAPAHPEPEHETDAAPNDAAVAAALSGGSITAVAAAPLRHGKHAEDLTFFQGIWVGAMQTFALLPGISRSGTTIVGGLFAGLTYEQASRFSFMLATPVIGLAALLKVPELFKHENRGILWMTLWAALVAGVAAYISVRFLMRYFHSKNLSPFGIYCIAFGAFSAYWLHFRH